MTRGMNTAIDLEAFKGDWDWQQAFACDSGDVHHADPTRASEPCESFVLDDVAEITHAVQGDNDGPSWVCVGRLADGRWFTLSAWCDYTGWGCQDGCTRRIAETQAAIVRLALTDDERSRLGIVLDI